jgi:hypothetical protein
MRDQQSSAGLRAGPVEILMVDRHAPQSPAEAGNVVRHPASAPPGSATLLRRLARLAHQFLLERVEQLLVDLDDDLFARADAATTDSLQQRFFDAMRVMRHERHAVRQRFQARLEALPESEARETKAGASLEERIAGLSLLEDDALEQRLAITTMAQRVERAAELDLAMLNRRTEALERQARAAGRPVEPLELGPRHFADAFVKALEPVELDGQVRLVLLKHFEHLVLSPTTELYKRLNDILARAGVLPDIDLAREALERARGSRSPAAPPNAPAPEAEAPLADGAPLGPAGHEDATGGDAPIGTPPTGHAAASARPAGPGPASPPSGGPAGPARLPGAFARSARQGLLRSLPGLRRHRRYSVAEDGGGAGADAVGLDLAGLVDLLTRIPDPVPMDEHAGDLDVLPRRTDIGELIVRQARVHGHAQPTLEEADEDTVNLVQMLFDEILDDENLPVPMRALLARLQFPILRVALLDGTFLSDVSHPARQFLNAVTRAGISWARAEERSRDRLFTVIESLVGRAAGEFEGDVTLFAVLHGELDEAEAAEQEAIRRAAERAVAQEQARIEADRTRRLVRRLVDHRTAAVVDPALRHFLVHDWQQVMLRAHQLEGGRSPAWKEAFSVLRRLTGGHGPEGEDLSLAIASGLSRLGRDPAVARTRAEEILELLAQGAGAEQAPVPAGRNEPLPVPPAEPELPPEVVRMPERSALDAANALAVDDWVELTTRGDRTVRCRLASVTDPPERCIFLTRKGVRIETLSRLEIAAGIEAGRIRRLDDRQLFDRALERVIDGLRGSGAAA